LKKAREKIRVQEEADRLKRRLLQRHEEQVKVQANRMAELENMIGLRTSAVPMWMNEPFMPRRQLGFLRADDTRMFRFTLTKMTWRARRRTEQNPDHVP
jgi:hypothetical protein